MGKVPRHAVITSFLNRTKDRFHEYNEPRSLEERLKMVRRIRGFSGVEVVHPYEISDPRRLARLLRASRLGISAVNVNVKAEPEFRDGALSSNDPGVRARAVEFIRNAKDFAAEVGADKVTCCPLNDGYEFSFHADYARAWKNMVAALGEAGSHRPEIPLFIEYKPAETRGRCFIDTAAKTLCLLRDAGIGSTGVTIDFGHSLMFGYETPAEAVCLVAESGRPFYIHINDNDGRWDWDYMAGTKNLVAYVEFLHYLQRYGYSDYLTSDTSPTRWDIAGTFEVNSRLTNKIWKLLRGLDRARFDRLIAERDHLKTWRFVEKEILSLR